MNIGSLINTGKMEIPFPGITASTPDLIDGLMNLIESTENCRADWAHWNPDEEADERDSGLIEKRLEDNKDPKFFFHYRPILMEQLAVHGAAYQEHLPFLQKSNDLYQLLKTATENVIAQLDDAMPGYDLVNRLHRQPEHLRHVLRMLHYKPGYETMAKAHDDKAFMTFHVADSRSGLHFFNDRQLYEVKEDTVLAFTGLKAQLHTDGKLQSMAHYVKNDELDKPRWAIVFFSHIQIAADEPEIRELVKQNSARYELALASSHT